MPSRTIQKGENYPSGALAMVWLQMQVLDRGLLAGGIVHWFAGQTLQFAEPWPAESSDLVAGPPPRGRLMHCRGCECLGVLLFLHLALATFTIVSVFSCNRLITVHFSWTLTAVPLMPWTTWKSSLAYWTPNMQMTQMSGSTTNSMVITLDCWLAYIMGSLKTQRSL